MDKERVLFLCTHNSARSQMAEGFLRSMAEVGVDLGGHTSKTVDALLVEPWDSVITVCDSANEACPVFPKKTNRLHWSFPDPSQAAGSEVERLAVFRRVRDSIRERLEGWLADRAASSSSAAGGRARTGS